jgi:transaldolase/glucose-6-phosphate isomerase
MNSLKQLESCGQAPWLDFLTRSLIQQGGLATLIERDGVKGVTSNPSIFEKAIGESDEYAEAIKDFLCGADRGVAEIYEHLAIIDIRAAADVLRPVYEETKGRDGYISLECSPYLANDPEGTITEARRLWAAVDRPNLMVKVPATPAGLPAIRRLIGEGLNINITLLFSVGVYEDVVEAYLAGLEDLSRVGGDLARTGSVASIFVSRIDVAVDKLLEGLGDASVANELRGKAGIANAKLAYGRYEALFSGPRWEALARAGARTQRLLWASTSTKNPAYKDTMYVEALISRDTVDTIPPATMDAFRDHGAVKADALEQDVDVAQDVIDALERHGVSLKAVTDELVIEGVRQFADSFDKLFTAVARQRRVLTEGEQPRFALSLGSAQIQAAYDAELEAWRKDGRIRRLWAADKTLWTGTDENAWCGWLTIVEDELADVERLCAFAGEVHRHGFKDIVLMGMGGSSLGPEVLGLSFAPQIGWPRFHVLDSTDPAQIATLEREIYLTRTLFIVSSKSGSTLEPNIFLDYFHERVTEARGDDGAGEQFVAVTDPGSPLETRARDLNLAHIFRGAPSIGGRYSALSKFGLAPAAAMGVDVKRLLKASLPMVRACGADVPPAENPGVQLGLALGVAATQFGRDKVTIITEPQIADLGAWLEQLLAESTGKQGRGFIPLAGEPVGPPQAYADDRFFAYLRLEGADEQTQSEAVDALERAGHPVARIVLKDIWSLGAEFFRWEIATAVAGTVIGINPFNQPDVEASKVKTTAIMDAYEADRGLPEEDPVFRERGLALYADAANAEALGRQNTIPAYLRSHLGRAGPGDYIAVLAYVERNPAHTRQLTTMRTAIRDGSQSATCLGYGPRFQHSTGQAYKGGPNSGIFIQITCDDPVDIAVPGRGYSFGVVKAAQARGDLSVLEERGRRALRVHVKDVEAGLAELSQAIESALQ